jgi:hypothetical protein
LDAIHLLLDRNALVIVVVLRLFLIIIIGVVARNLEAVPASVVRSVVACDRPDLTL